MNTSQTKLLRLALHAYENNQLTEDDRDKFGRDHRQFAKQELTFRELLEAIRQPTGELKKAMEAFYADSAYKRTFKGK